MLTFTAVYPNCQRSACPCQRLMQNNVCKPDHVTVAQLERPIPVGHSGGRGFAQ
jgi:hypothetical protein